MANITAGPKVSRPPHRFTLQLMANTTAATVALPRSGRCSTQCSTNRVKHQVATSTDTTATATTPNTLPNHGGTTP